jgi:hypothetical protein
VAKRKTLNLKIIESNLTEAIEELQTLTRKTSSGTLNEAEFHVRLLHAYHHLNFSWNIRKIETSEYANLTDRQFKRWGKYPKRIENL